MKTSKVTQSNPAPEECGVWLDTVELKGKAKQKKAVRPISKMLNPLARGSGYSLAVVFNFTQTKTEMPRTKQSSISSYFLPRSKSDEASEGKRGRESDVEMRVDGDVPEQDEEHRQVRDVQPHKMQQNRPAVRQPDKMTQNIHRRVREERRDEMERSRGSSVPFNPTLIDFDLSEGKTSTQKAPQLAASSRHDDEKENSLLPESFSPPRQRDAEDSPARLFTQDSDGFRVIAHRARRSPLKNSNDVVTAAVGHESRADLV